MAATYEGMYCAARAAFSNRAHRGAFCKGAMAKWSGGDLSWNPYRDRRTSKGAVTYARGYIGAWNDGWHWAKKNGFGRARS